MNESKSSFERELAALCPAPLRSGDVVRFVSPASPPTEEGVAHATEILRSWGLRVQLARNVFSRCPRLDYLAGTDEERLADFNEALRDPEVRAIIATRGGKGAYRIADKIDFAAARADPKFVVGFSDITILHLALWRQCRLMGIHGAIAAQDAAFDASATNDALRLVLMDGGPHILTSHSGEATSALTTKGNARGRLIGGNLDMVATSAGWTLPSLRGAILLLEAVNMGLGQVDRQLTMLANSGCVAELAGVAIGQFTEFATGNRVLDVLGDHLSRWNVPVLGGLPLGHGPNPRTAITGAIASLDADAATLTLEVHSQPDENSFKRTQQGCGRTDLDRR
jgi:muramoyltetrapeptide carboxypeptidase